MKMEKLIRGSAHSLMWHSSLFALISAASLSGAAHAQSTEPVVVDEIIVTGTGIRGVAPVGSNLISVGREAIEATAAQTVQQILKSVPALSNLGQSAHSNNVTPTIHNLGAGASNSTLSLIDGHRFSLGRQQQPNADPGIIPPNAIERVEVLADGASSIYGSDAVAGVVNFVTRRNFDGLELAGQRGYGDHYETWSGSFLAGKNWEGGNIMFAAAYSDQGELFSRYRDSLNPDHRSQGGGTFLNFNCDPAVLQPGGTGNLFQSATALTSFTNAVANATCSNYQIASALPHNTRANGMIKMRQEITPNLVAGVDAVYSDRRSRTSIPRGTYQGKGFRSGPQANPFYTNPAGYTGTANDMIVRWNADDLLGPGAYTIDNSKNWYVNAHADYDVTDDWRISALALYGEEVSVTGTFGALCGSCANLAFNGTTNTNGNLTTPSIPGTTTIVLGLPLTTNNALDVWNPAATNRTSKAVRERLIDSDQIRPWLYSTSQLRLNTDASIFKLPGGDLKVAAGVEYVRYTLDINITQPNNTGPASLGSTYRFIPLSREVSSAFAETVVPLVGPEMSIPAVRRLVLTGAVRYDSYSDTGSTTNPKVGIDWEVTEDIKLRANWASSFVAPQLTSVGDRSRGGLTSFTCFGTSCSYFPTPFTVSVADFPGVVGLPGCNPGATTCSVPLTTTGIAFNSSPADPKPSTGKSWSVGFDATPSFLPRFTVSATFFNVAYDGLLTGASFSNAINAPSLGLIKFFPNGATAADIASIVPAGAAQLGNLPNTIYYIQSSRQGNYTDMVVQGIDASFSYQQPTDFGTFAIGGTISQMTRFDQQLKGTSASYSVLNTTGVNTAFGAPARQARANAGWNHGALSVDIYANYVGSYRNWSSSTVIPVQLTNSRPTGGGDNVRSNTTVDLNIRYELSSGQVLGTALPKTTLFLDATNVFDREPAFYNGASGYDNYTGNPIGRVITVGARARF